MRRTLSRAALYAGGLFGAAVACLLALTVGSSIGMPIMILATLGALAFTAILLLPTDWLPSAALVVFLVVPRVALSASDIVSTVSPALLVMVLWYVKSWAGARRAGKEGAPHRQVSAWAIILVVGLALWIVVSLMYRGPRLTSLAWVFAFGVVCLVIVFVPNAARAVRLLQTTFLWSAVVMAAYSVIEYILGYNPLFDPVFAIAGAEPLQHWSVYRASGSLGHPLYAGLFFAMAFGIAFGRRFSGGGNRNLLFAAVSMLGVVLTVSRSSVGAVAVTAAVIVLPSLVRRSSLSVPTRAFLALLVVCGVFAITQVSVFQDRLGSLEAQGSTHARDAVFTLAVETARAFNWLGAGPAQALAAAAPFNPNGVIIESAYLQVLISLGLPGLALFGLLIVAGALRAVRVGSYAGLGAITAYAVCSGFFNILESSRPALILLGFALLLAWRDVPAESQLRSTGGTAATRSAIAPSRVAATRAVRHPRGL